MRSGQLKRLWDERETIRRLAACGLLIGMTSIFLFHFACIWVWGEIVIREPNRGILIGEISLMVGALGFAIYCLVKER